MEAPIFNCGTSISSCDPRITYETPSASDNCGLSSLGLKSGLPSGSIFPVGTTIITYEATDIHGNTSLCSFNVVIHPTPAAYIESTNITCHGQNNGTADLTVLGGSAPFNYKWSNGQTSGDLTNLSVGTYSVAITDQYGCATSAQTTIQEPSAINLFATIQNVKCHGAATGAIDLTVSGGAGSYEFFWSDGQQTEDANALVAGNYLVIVKDGEGCAASLSTIIYQTDTIIVQLTIDTATCLGSDGSIYSSISGGTPPYSYSWSNGQTGSTLVNAVSGGYTLYVTDANNCNVSSRGMIPSVSNLQVATVNEDALCYGAKNGTSRVIAYNAQAPYNILWSNGDKGIVADSLSAGSYTVFFSDANGCKDTLEVDIGQPDTLVALVTVSKTYGPYAVSQHGACDGWIDVETLGGTTDFSYLWSNGASENYISNLCAGTYSLVITDANGCAISQSIELNEALPLEMPNGFSPNGDGDNDAFVVRGIDAYPENELTIFNRWGNIVFQKENYQNDWYGENNQLEPLPDATYFVILQVTIPADGIITLTGYVDLRRN
jgi:gliding motility-associated-like protein